MSDNKSVLKMIFLVSFLLIILGFFLFFRDICSSWFETCLWIIVLHVSTESHILIKCKLMNDLKCNNVCDFMHKKQIFTLVIKLASFMRNMPPHARAKYDSFIARFHSM